MLVLSMHVAKINSKHIRMYVIICTKYWKSAIGFDRMTDRARYYMKCVKGTLNSYSTTTEILKRAAYMRHALCLFVISFFSILFLKIAFLN